MPPLLILLCHLLTLLSPSPFLQRGLSMLLSSPSPLFSHLLTLLPLFSLSSLTLLPPSGDISTNAYKQFVRRGENAKDSEALHAMVVVLPHPHPQRRHTVSIKLDKEIWFWYKHSSFSFFPFLVPFLPPTLLSFFFLLLSSILVPFLSSPSLTAFFPSLPLFCLF